MEGVPDIQPDELEINEDDPNVVLGEGAFGIVYKGKCRGLNVAIKMPKSFDLTGDALAEFKDEVKMMARLYHPRIALFMGACISGDDISVVSELLDGDIEHVLRRDPHVSLYQRMLWARQAAQGMAWVHGAGVIHRDLPSNLLYSKSENAVKVCDFGFTILVQNRAKAQETKGSPFYVAPEVLTGQGASRASDVYAFGIILHFFITGDRVPFAGADQRDVSALFAAVIAGERPVLPEKKALCPKSLRVLTHSCWDADPKLRPSFEDIIAAFNKDVLVDSVVMCRAGRHFWKEAFGTAAPPDAGSRGDLTETAEWPVFLAAFCGAFADGGAVPDPAEPLFKCLKAVFCPAAATTVTLAGFGRMLGFFGPLERGTWMLGLLDTMSAPWFWGDTSREVAGQKLANEPRGSFLIRYASEDAYYTITYVALNAQQRREIFHTRVVHQYASSVFAVPTTRAATQTCHSLAHVVTALTAGTSHVLRDPCPGGPYVSFFTTSVASSNNFHGGYAPLGGFEGPPQQQFEDRDFDAFGPAVTNLKESSVMLPPHLLNANRLSLPNNSPSPALPVRSAVTAAPTAAAAAPPVVVAPAAAVPSMDAPLSPSAGRRASMMAPEALRPPPERKTSEDSKATLNSSSSRLSLRGLKDAIFHSKDKTSPRKDKDGKQSPKQ